MRKDKVEPLGYVVFQSAQAATMAEAVLRRAGLAVRLVPAPRHLSAGCGTALGFEPRNGLAEQVEARLRRASVPFVAIHVLDNQAVQSQERGG